MRPLCRSRHRGSRRRVASWGCPPPRPGAASSRARRTPDHSGEPSCLSVGCRRSPGQPLAASSFLTCAVALAARPQHAGHAGSRRKPGRTPWHRSPCLTLPRAVRMNSYRFRKCNTSSVFYRVGVSADECSSSSSRNLHCTSIVFYTEQDEMRLHMAFASRSALRFGTDKWTPRPRVQQSPLRYSGHRWPGTHGDSHSDDT